MKLKIFIFALFTCFKTEAQTSVLNLADSLYTYGKYSEAIKNYLDYDNQNEVFDRIAKAYIAVGNYDAALNTYEKHVTNKPGHALSKFDYGKLLYKTKNYKMASQVFNDLVYQDYKNPNYHYELGLSLEKLKDSTAFNRFYNAFQLDSTHQKAIYRLAKNYLKKGQNTLADKYIDIGLSTYENNKELISLKAQNFYVTRQYENAIIWFEKLIALNESTQFIHEKLSYAYVKTLQDEKAIEHQLLALQFEPNDTSNLYILALLYQNIDDLVNAEKYLKVVLKILDEPLHQEYMKLGVVLNRQKRHKEALEAYQKAVRESPSSEEANFFLILTKDQYYKDFDTRIRLYESFKEKFPESGYVRMADHRISKLKKEKFLKSD